MLRTPFFPHQTDPLLELSEALWVLGSAICPSMTCSHIVAFHVSPDLLPEEQAEEGLYNHGRWGGPSLPQGPGCFLW